MEHATGDLAATLARTTARLDQDVKAAQQTAAVAVTTARLAQATADPPEGAAIAVAAPATAPATAPVVSRVPPPREASRENPPAVAARPGQIHPGMPTYTGALPMPAEPNGPLGMMRPFPVQAQPPTIAEPSAPIALPRPDPRVPPTPGHMAMPFHAPLLQSNPLMTTGIFDAPVEPGAIAVAFAVDLGPATTIEAMRTRWSELKASQSPLFDSLKPLVALKDGGKAGQELHLIAGPLSNAAASARFCAVLSGTGIPCQAGVYEGQRLAAH